MRKKKRSNKKSSQTRTQRDANVISTHRVLYSPFQKNKKVSNLTEDRRRWRPANDRYLRRTDGQRVDYTVGYQDKKPQPRQVNSKLRFVNPKKVVVCQKRLQRRQALFMLNRIGKGAGGSKKPTRRRKMRPESHIRCNRRR